MEVDGSGDNSGRVITGDVLDAVRSRRNVKLCRKDQIDRIIDSLHTSLTRSDESRSTESSVVENSDVVFVSWVSSLGEHDL